MEDTWVRVIVMVLGMVISNLATIKVLRADMRNHEDDLKEFKSHAREDIRQLYSKVNTTMSRAEIERLVKDCTEDTNRLIRTLIVDFHSMREDVIRMEEKNKSLDSRESVLRNRRITDNE